MESLLTNFSETHRILSYLIIFFGIFIEGEVILLLAGVLSHRGFLDISDVIIIASSAVVLHDLLYWSIGRKLLKTNKKRILFINLEKLKGILERLRIDDGLYIFISKFAWSLNRIVLISSGYLKISAKELLRYSIPAAIIWSTTLISLGHVFASKTGLLKKDITTAAVLLTIFVVGIILLESLLRKTIIRKKITK